MGQKLLLGCVVHVSTTFALVLNPPQSLQGTSTNPPVALDATSNASAIHVASIPAVNSQPSTSGPTSSLSNDNFTAPADNATLTAMRISCDGAPFNPGPATFASCVDAWEYTKSGLDLTTFGDRAFGDPNYRLPIRFLSGKSVPDIPTRSYRKA